MKIKFILSLVIASLLFTSCASIFTGSKRNVLFETDPSGAKVFINGFEKGTTPVQIKVKADDRVDFKLDNYKEKVVVMDSKFNLVAILNGFSIIGWGVDALTGSLKRVDTKYVKVTLENTDKTAFIKYMENGKINKVNINEGSKVIETVIVLN
ncbi:PEGA domain-containing protein [Flavobacterium sp. GSP27]|uniref:PEGA domain-containing protein n=1 Tax=unclassified Flavobacterium TaxID=196869 RepID=UPI000F81F5B5|nr:MULTISPECIES: PEGA domain-containing protein [unclassified Flavobacterium]RTY84076.1 PEGA domain-containing protein [Flavobacterium sp. LS1P28]RTY96168.1 PEGA domain-containing protein [Flavobacterium sp. GSN2]RTZ11339.1 PEGA domain-containing protein [Flavobacterium sp. GSP27]